jgi:hypothetical protein
VLTPVFSGHVTEQVQLVLAANEQAQRQAHLRTLAGQDVEVIVRKKRTQRSNEQNALIHAVASALADHCGNSLGEMKLLLMGECWGWQTVRGHEIPVKPHTSDMTVEEATQFIDWLLPWSAQNFPEVRLGPQGRIA